MSQIVIGDISPYTQATAIASQTVFGTNWTANAASDVVVYQTPVGQLPNDVTQILTSSQFSIAFVGSQQQVQVTLVTGANAGDIITITRQTPADRENLYSNTNFVPSMLNNDFGILTLVDQQAQLVNQLIGPRYNYSAVITDVVDTILPILGANQTWIKNSNNTGFIPYTLPTTGVAPNNATYITLTSESGVLPDSFSLSGIGTGLMVNVPGSQQIITSTILGTSNQILVTNGNGVGNIGIAITNNPIIPGTAGMGIPAGTTAQRITPTPPSVGLRYNSDLDSLEFFSTGTWTQLNDNTDGIVLPGLQNQLGYYATTDNVISGLATGNNGVLITSNTGVPSISSTLPAQLLIPTPKINSILDTNGNLILNFVPVSSAVNSIVIHNNSTGMGPLISSNGSDTNIPLNLGSFGNAPIGLITTSLTQPILIYSGTASQHLTRFNMANTSADRSITFQDANGTLAFLSDITNDGGVNNGTINQLAYYASTGNIVSGLSSINNSVLTTNASGVPTWVTLTNGQLIIGSSGAPQATTATYPSTTTINQIFYSSSNNVVTGLSTSNNGVLITSNTGVPSISTTLPTAVQTNITTVGTIGTGIWQGSIIALSYGGTNNNLTANNGGIVWSDASKLNILAGTSTSGQMLQSGATATPSWTSTTWPSTSTLGDIIYGSSTNIFSKLAGNTTSGIQYLSQTGTGTISAAPIWKTISGSDITGSALTRTNDTNVTLTLGGSPTTALLNASSITVGWSGQLAIGRGGTGVSSVTIAPTATAFSGWDSNLNLSANNFINGYVTTATSAGTTTLTVSSAQQQYFTGSTTQTVILPVTSTLALGQTFLIVNNSTDIVTVQSSGANTIQAMAANTSLVVTCILTSGTTAASWNAEYVIKSAITLPLSLANGGTAANLTATNGGIVYSSSTTLAITAAGSSGQLLQSAGATTPSWTTSTYPSTNAINTILYASSANVMAALATANNGFFSTNSSGVPSITSMGNNTLVASNSSGTVAARAFSINIVTFSANGTYTPSTGLIQAFVKQVGGGGGGGGSAAGGVSTAAAGSGGGGGEYAEGLFTAATIGSSQTVTIGGGGGGGGAGANNGTNGGTTSFGALLTAIGGTGGIGNAASSVGINFGSAGGSGGSGGSFHFQGGFGGYGLNSIAGSLLVGGAGGTSFWGAGAACSFNSAGSNGVNYGSGGGGASTQPSGAAHAGGGGQNGYCIVTEYIIN